MVKFSRLSSMQKGLFAIVALAIAGGGYYLYTTHMTPSPPGGGVACSMIAKLCPDGVHSVSRSGPNCEFAACPSTPSALTLDAKINEPISAFGFSITPLEVLQDSRCPSGPNVQCIQAGTVEVKAVLGGDLGAYTATLELGKPTVNEQVSITLVSVSPPKTEAQTISPDQYVFTFKIEKIN